MTPADLTAELLRIQHRFNTIFNSALCEMKPGFDDSIEGFNEAWEIAREIFAEEIGRAAAQALACSALMTDHTKWVSNWKEFLAVGGVVCFGESQTEIELRLPEPYKFSIKFQDREKAV
jgi:hypothetical protein